MLQTYTVEIRLDVTDEGHEAMTNIVRQYARDMQASAMLLSPRKKPMVMARSSDAFYDVSEIDLIEPSDMVHDPWGSTYDVNDESGDSDGT